MAASLSGVQYLWVAYLGAAARWLSDVEQKCAAQTNPPDRLAHLYTHANALLSSPQMRVQIPAQVLTPVPPDGVASAEKIVHAQALYRAIQKLIYARTMARGRALLPFRADDGGLFYAQAIARLTTGLLRGLRRPQVPTADDFLDAALTELLVADVP